MTAAARERAALVATLHEVGPDAPTLCGDWTTRDLAAHLILRERHPIASLGIMVAPLADRTARAQQRLADGDGMGAAAGARLPPGHRCIRRSS